MKLQVGDRVKVIKHLDLLFNSYNVGQIYTISELSDGTLGIADDHLSLSLVTSTGIPADDTILSHFKKVIRLRAV